MPNSAIEDALKALEGSDTSLARLRCHLVQNNMSVADLARNIEVPITPLNASVSERTAMPVDVAQKISEFMKDKIDITPEGLILPWEIKKLRRKMRRIRHGLI